jgi:hypothetical protein
LRYCVIILLLVYRSLVSAVGIGRWFLPLVLFVGSAVSIGCWYWLSVFVAWRIFFLPGGMDY